VSNKDYLEKKRALVALMKRKKKRLLPSRNGVSLARGKRRQGKRGVAHFFDDREEEKEGGKSRERTAIDGHTV